MFEGLRKKIYDHTQEYDYGSYCSYLAMCWGVELLACCNKEDMLIKLEDGYKSLTKDKFMEIIGYSYV